MMKPPSLSAFCTLNVELGPIREMGQGRAGQRRIIPIIGGRVTGKLSGNILNLGADWQTIQADGVAHLDTRYAFETNDGALIEIVNKGVRHGPAAVIEAMAKGQDQDPSTYYMRTTATLETGDERYSWVNRMLFVGTGRRLSSAVQVDLYMVE